MKPAPALALAVAGGLLSTAGALVFALRRPDPSPAVFGYHGIWHALMVVAAACHTAMVALRGSERAPAGSWYGVGTDGEAVP